MRNILFIAVLLLAACGESPTPILSCEASVDITPDCRFQNPEDLVRTPSGRSVLVSQMGSMDGSSSGNLASYTLADRSIQILFPPDAIVDDRSWGAPDCGPPDVAAFAPHGIDLERRADGRTVLLVVNHGRRESVEFLEVVEDPNGTSLTWRGCAEGPEEAYLNDVVAGRDGGFWVTHMMPRDTSTIGTLMAAILGSDTGFVYAWDQEAGFSVVVGSEGGVPNGIEKSADERYLFINMYLGSEVRKLDLSSGEVVATAAVPSPDNSTWSDAGRLLVASHTDNFLELTGCQSLSEGSCGYAFEIVALDPENLAGDVVLANRGAPMGGATVAIQAGDELILGTFAGDRIARSKMAAPE